MKESTISKLEKYLDHKILDLTNVANDKACLENVMKINESLKLNTLLRTKKEDDKLCSMFIAYGGSPIEGTKTIYYQDLMDFINEYEREECAETHMKSVVSYYYKNEEFYHVKNLISGISIFRNNESTKLLLVEQISGKVLQLVECKYNKEYELWNLSF